MSTKETLRRMVEPKLKDASEIRAVMNELNHIDPKDKEALVEFGKAQGVLDDNGLPK